MKILAVCSYPPPFVGGSVVYIYNMVANTPQPVDVLTRKLFKHENELNDHNCTLIRKKFVCRGHDLNLLRRLIMLIGILFYYPYLILKNKYDVVVLNQEIVWNSLLIACSKIFKTKTVGIGYAEEISMSLRGSSLKWRAKKLLIKNVYTKADRFITVCEFTKNMLVTCGLNPHQIDVIPPMLLPNKASTSMTIVQKGNSILSVGRLIQRKGFHLLIEAVKILKKEIPDIKLNIVGNGPEKEFLLETIKRDGLEGHINIFSDVDDETLSTFYHDCKVFVIANIMMPDGDCEGTPTVLIEASHFGKPVIAGNMSGADAAVQNGVTGYLIDPQNISELVSTIRKILNNSDLALKMGEAGKQRVNEQHNPKKSGIIFYRVLKKICSKNV